MSYKLIIAGSRHLTISHYQITYALYAASWPKPSAVICGMALGPDLAGKSWAEKRNIDVVKMPARWKQYGKRAGPIRNAAMARAGDRLLAFWDGKSAGTHGMISLMSDDETVRKLRGMRDVYMYGERVIVVLRRS